MRTALVAVAVALFVVGCGASPGATQGPEPTRTAASPPRPPETREETAPTVSAVPQQIMDAILDDAAARSGVARDHLLALRAQAVTWPDGGLGCPEPGMMYIQVLVDGYWVVVSAAGQELDYRGDGRGGFRLCTSPSRERHPPVNPGGGGGAI